MAYGLYLQGSLSYYPNKSPTVLRGPSYPAFVAVLLSVNEQWYPTIVQVAQALLHACTCLLAYGVAIMLFDPRHALIAGLLTSIHPYLIWYTSKVVTESFATFLFTAIVFGVIFVLRHHKPLAIVILGVTLGTAALCRGSFLPLVLLTPLFMLRALQSQYRWRIASSVLAIALALISTWTFRNYTLTHRLIPVHSLLGYNLRAGDVHAEFYEHAPFSYFQLMTFKQLDISFRGDTISHPWLRNSETMIALEADNELIERSLKRYAYEPLLVVRKALLGPVMFWTLSSSPAATVFSSLFQIPLLIFFIVGGVRAFKLHGVFSNHTIPILLIATYFLCYIPILAIARFSVVLVPTMLLYAVVPFRKDLTNSQSKRTSKGSQLHELSTPRTL
ncbi:MAG: glycosyl transferase family 39 [Bacteroidetes bacterium]|nr:glycosyl transferase family 39 [Bacteroidota bacterium]